MSFISDVTKFQVNAATICRLLTRAMNVSHVEVHKKAIVFCFNIASVLLITMVCNLDI
jgi:hypothetical protein